ncbi:Rieske 2Fe-2S domain-containing protein [Streptomyces sp. NPDC007904]|jgi:Rieske Fe-S protein|uniref:Rieske (2Fe-2S) protein n=1 Tax=Streptomyces sp. NPDC007904 TaxID=3364787 RepID=UPI0036E7679B
MTHRATRRTVLLAAGAAGTAALTAGCGGDDGGEGPSSGAAAPDTPGGQELAATGDIPVGGGTVLRDEKIVVTQPEEGDFRAFSAICTHQHCVVAEVSGGTINCACHGSRFRIADGSVEKGPATGPLPEEPITVRGNSIRRA